MNQFLLSRKNYFAWAEKSKEASFSLFLKEINTNFTSRLVQSKQTDLKEFYDSFIDFLMYVERDTRLRKHEMWPRMLLRPVLVWKCIYDVFNNYLRLKRVATRNNGSMVDIPRIRLKVANFYFQSASIFNKTSGKKKFILNLWNLLKYVHFSFYLPFVFTILVYVFRRYFSRHFTSPMCFLDLFCNHSIFWILHFLNQK